MAEIIRAVGADDFVKIAAISGRDIAEKARQIHSLSPTACAALGRTLCGTALMGCMLKGDGQSVTVRINGGGSIGNIVAVADNEGNVRGYAGNPATDLPTRADGKLDVGGIVGKNGTLTVSRDLGMREPYIGSTELVSGEIAEDLSAYFVESEQVGTACALGVLVDTDLTVRAAGGFIVQLLPGAPEGLIEKLEENIVCMDQLTTILDEDGLEEVIDQVLRGLQPRILQRSSCAYRCNCSRSRVLRALRSIGRQALSELSQDEVTRVSCEFCGSEFCFTSGEISALAQEAGD